MTRLHHLPAGLITLLFSSLALSQESVQVSTNNPFRDVAKLAPPTVELPVCCLKPLPSNEPSEELLLSFEEWKGKQERSLQSGKVEGGKAGGTNSKPSTPSDNVPEHPGNENDESHRQEKPQQVAPVHFQVPITDRFNFASSDCSARVHHSHRSARSISSLLSHKKDRYMLSPCNNPGEDKFVIVELCDFIRIDTVQLANFEFFSGVFKDFSISFSPRLIADPEAWTPAGIFRAKNIRGIQTFHPDTSTLRGFYRFIRIDFHSHYGNEFYCPVSLLRVYGLTDLEQWKWDVWENEYNERQAALGRRAMDADKAPSAENVVQIIRKTPETQSQLVEPPTTSSAAAITSTDILDTSPVPTYSAETVPSAEAFTTTEEAHEPSASKDGPASSATSTSTSNPAFSEIHSKEASFTTTPSPASESASTSSTLSEPATSEQSSESQSVSTPSVAPPPEAASSENPTTTSPSTSTSVQTIVTQEQRPPPASGAGASESIYRTIMMRLSALESNSTLYLRYVEEQTRSMRDALRRLEEDLGRLEGITKAQSSFLQKTITEWERQRKRIERDHGDLQSRVDNLADEVILEKRLGIAQLCLLLTVLVFMVLTRGSRGEPIISPISNRRHDSLREWGRRHLSSLGSGEWARSGENASQSQTPIPEPKKTEKVKFPLENGHQSAYSSSFKNNVQSTPRKRTPSEIRAPHPRHFISHRPRTPASALHSPRSPAHAHSHSVGTAPMSEKARPRLRRTNSHNAAPALPHSTSLGAGLTSAPLPSVKKWAKSAHLHEIRKLRNENTSPSPTKVSALQTGSGEKGLEEALRGLSNTSPRLEPASAPGSGSTMFWLESSPQLDATKLNEARGRSKDWARGLRAKSKSKLDLHLPISSPEQNGTSARELPEATGFRLGSPYRGQTRPGSVPGRNARAFDFDTESESWIDTDIESADLSPTASDAFLP